MISENFKKNYLHGFSIEKFILTCYTNKVDELQIRPSLWKLFLQNLPSTNDLSQIFKLVNQNRKLYEKQKEEFSKKKKFQTDPLLNSKNVRINYLILKQNLIGGLGKFSKI